MTMKLNSRNEWDRLRAVVVGTVDGFVPGLEYRAGGEVPDVAREIASRAFPSWYLEEVAEDLDDLCEIFRDAGVTVIRPAWTEPSPSFRTPNWAAEGFDLYNVRDLHIIFGNTLVVSAPASRFRLFERYAFHDLLYEHFFPDGLRWISAPLPRLRGQYLRELERPRTELERTEEQLHTHLSHGLSEVFHELEETEVIFDAANIIRLGRDVLFLISSTGNRKAADWLRTTLGPEYEVHLTHSYRSSHLDSTIMPLRAGTVLLNGARVNEMTSPAVFRTWDRIYFADVAPVPEPEVEFYRSVRLPAYHALQELGVDSPLGHISSAWGGLNVLSLDPETVLVHDRQVGLARVLEKRGFTVVPVRMRHCYTMLGGLHCTTLDVIREEN
jgi:glycine amidinotransferase